MSLSCPLQDPHFQSGPEGERTQFTHHDALLHANSMNAHVERLEQQRLHSDGGGFWQPAVMSMRRRRK